MFESRTNDRIHRILRRITFWIGVLALALLVVLSAIGLLTFGRSLSDLISLEAEQLIKLLDIVLLVFIIIELMNIAIAFIEGRRVIYTVFEAVLVAIARKIIVSGTEPMDLDKATSLALITLAVGVTWWLMTRVDLKPLPGIESRGEPASAASRQPTQKEQRRAS